MTDGRRTSRWRTAGGIVPAMLLAWVSAWAVDEGIGKHIETIRTGPSLYLTPRAAATPLPPSIMGPYDEVPDGTEAKKVLDATLALSVAGDKAREAVDVLVRRFPRAVHVVMLDDLVYSAGSGSFEDWVLTKTVGVKNRLELDSPFGRYEVIDPCSDFIEVSQEHELHQPSYSGGRLRSAGVTIKMTFVFYAGACALHRITGLDPGTDRRQWVQWLQARPAASATGSSSSPTIVSGQAPPPPAATPAVTAKSSPPAASAPAAAPAAPAPSTSTGLRTEQVSFEQLLERSPVGTRLEVRLVAGSVLVGKLVSVNRAGVRIDVKGASVVPVKREAVRHISLIVYR